MTAQIQGSSAAPTPLAYFATQTFKAFNTNKTSWIGLLFFVIVVVLGDRSAGALAVRSHRPEHHGESSGRRASSTGWAPTASAATRCRASSMARGFSLVIGVVSTLAAMVIGSAIGMLAGWHGGRVDTITMQAMDVLLPSLR
jgi:peptide/nickel transport system permease protein